VGLHYIIVEWEMELKSLEKNWIFGLFCIVLGGL